VPDRAYRAIVVDRDRPSDDERSIWRAALDQIIGRHPREVIGFAAVFAAMTAIVVNALYLQPGPHPAPIFKLKPRPVAASEPPPAVPLPRPRPAEAVATKADAAPARPRAEIVTAIQRELAKRNFYDGPADGLTGPRTDAAIRDFVQAAGLKTGSEPTEDLLRGIERSQLKAPARAATPPASRSDPIGELIAPSPKRVLAVQRALADYGYGQVKPTGTLGPETQGAIEKFERERKLPITGQISDRLVRELAAVTGQPLE